MKVLFIGGTGNISTASSRLAIERGMELYLLNRGNRPIEIAGAHSIVANINDETAVSDAIKDLHFDAVVNWIAFTPADIERDIRLFKHKCDQYIFISSASAYQKPATSPIITESTPLANPYWQYSRDKIASEERLTQALRDEDFPGVIVRPSLTYDTVIPLPLSGWNQWTLIQRMLDGKPIVVQGDGTSLWTITHSDDFAIGLVGLLGHRQSIGHAFHITSDELLTWDQIHQQTAEAAGCNANIIHLTSEQIISVAPEETGSLLGDKSVSAIFDNSKIKRFVPEFNATIRYRDGIERTLNWFKADPKRMVISDNIHELNDKLIALHARLNGQEALA